MRTPAATARPSLQSLSHAFPLDCIVCFQDQADAQRCEQVLGKRVAQFALPLAPTQTRVVACGRLAERDTKQHKRRRETCTGLGFTLSCTRHHRGNCKGGWRTEQTRLRRSLATCPQLVQIMRHAPWQEQAEPINHGLRGH